MLIIAVGNSDLYRRIQNIPVLNKFFRLRLDAAECLHDIRTSAAVYKSFYTAEGTSKETVPNRFSEIDKVTLALIDPDKQVAIHDVGVSSGITSLELFQQLASRGQAFKFYISDKFSRYRYSGKLVRRLFDEDGNLAQAYAFGLLCDRHVHGKYFISRLGYELVSRFRGPESIDGELCLYHPGIAELLSEGAIQELRYDLFRSQIESRFDFVRCMNVLNLSYFPPAKISTAIRNLYSSLNEDGILQVGKTNPAGINEVSFFRKANGKLLTVEEINGGSEISEILNNMF
jgi:hypothetical protein